MENKKVYIPSIEELEELEKIISNSNIISTNNNFDLYSYCLAKKIEIILACGGLEHFGQEEKEDYTIVKSVIKYYPSDIWCTPYNNDIYIAKEIIFNNKTQYKFGLDNVQFLSPKLLNENVFIKDVIDALLKTLMFNNEYRFEYADSIILNNIFLKQLSKEHINSPNYQQLLKIEPAYILDIDKNNFNNTYYTNDEITKLRQANTFANAIHSYSSRYGIHNTYENSEEKEVKQKKLVRFLQENKNN